MRIGRYLKNNRSGALSIDDALLNSLDAVGISESGRMIVKRVVMKLKELMEKSNKNLPDLIFDIYEITGLNRAFTHTRSIRNTESLMNLKRFHEISENYCKTHGESLDSFIHYLEILDTVGVNFEASEVENVDAVRVMTMHAVKGLQFRTVIVTNLAEKRFPLERTAKEPLIPKELNPDIKRHLFSLGKLSPEEKNDAIKNYERESLLYEERRLCYVSFTRAKEKLFLTFSRSYNKDEDSSAPSQFLEEIDFRDNKDIFLIEDKEEKGTVFAPCSRREQFRSMLKSQLIESLDSEDFNSILSRLATYYAVREGKLINYPKIVDWDNVIDVEYIKDRLNTEVGEKSYLTFDADSFTFSPSALLEYDECPKKYELSHIFRMPERGAFEFTAASTGTFVHEVLENGVRKCFKTSGEFKSLAVELSKLPQYEGVKLDDVSTMIDVFWERNKGKYDEKSKVESWVNVTLGGFRFNGKIDRIDFIKDKDVEIIDYKTNRQAIPPKHRSWQLGFYALAVKKQMNLNPVRLTLEMLALEKPFEAEVDESGIVTSGSCKSFNVADVEKELIECAAKIKKDYETGFLPSKDDTPCRFCGYKFYCPKWEDTA